MNAFARWLKKSRLTLADVATALGVNVPAVWKYTRDDFWPTRKVAIRLLRFTGGAVTPNDLLGDDEPLAATPEYHLAQKANDAAAIRREAQAEIARARREAAAKKRRDEKRLARRKRADAKIRKKERDSARRKEKRLTRAEAGRADQRPQ